MPQSFDAIFVSSGAVRILAHAREGQLGVPVLVTSSGHVKPKARRHDSIYEFHLKGSALHGRSAAIAALVTDVNEHTIRTTPKVKIHNGKKLVYTKTLSEDVTHDRADVGYDFFFDFFAG